ncbi:MAG: hypothetical protein AB1486_18700 [Planctomycetota bacterium]
MYTFPDSSARTVSEKPRKCEYPSGRAPDPEPQREQGLADDRGFYKNRNVSDAAVRAMEAYERAFDEQVRDRALADEVVGWALHKQAEAQERLEAMMMEDGKVPETRIGPGDEVDRAAIEAREDSRILDAHDAQVEAQGPVDPRLMAADAGMLDAVERCSVWGVDRLSAAGPCGEMYPGGGPPERPSALCPSDPLDIWNSLAEPDPFDPLDPRRRDPLHDPSDFGPDGAGPGGV